MALCDAMISLVRVLARSSSERKDSVGPGESFQRKVVPY